MTCTCDCHRDPAAVGTVFRFGRERVAPSERGQRSILEHSGPWWLYQIVRDSDGALLYVGQTVAPTLRYQQHRTRYTTSDYLMTVVARYDTRAEALDAESRMIAALRPPDNLIGADYNRRTLNLAERRAARELDRAMEAADEAIARRFGASS